MLPFSRSLRKLRAAVRSTNDLLWLTYAMIHPLTRTTQWCALHLDVPFRRGIDPRVLQCMVNAQSPLATLTNWDSHESSESDGSLVWRTATVAGAAVVVRSLDKTKMIAQFSPGDRVELCDTTTAIRQLSHSRGILDSDETVVVVKGIGLGRILKRHLSAITDTYYDVAPRASLTTLSVVTEMDDKDIIEGLIQVAGSALRHLRVINPSGHPPDGIAQSCPHLESLEMGTTKSWLAPPAVVAMPNLKYVGFICDGPSLGASFNLLLGLRAVQIVRLRLCMTASTVLSETAIRRHMSALIASKKTLRSLTLIIDLPPSVSWERMVNALGGKADMAQCKLAFLSTIGSAHVESRSNRYLLGLDTHVLRLIFDFAGPSTRCSLVFVSNANANRREGGIKVVARRLVRCEPGQRTDSQAKLHEASLDGLLRGVDEASRPHATDFLMYHV